MGKYFGTDGFRGKAGKELTSLHAFKIGRFLGYFLKSKKKLETPKIAIGKDTRLSCYMLEASLVAGITSSGADAYLLHVTTTPCVSFITKNEDFDLGIMISASHNPFYDNGIKIMEKSGEKISDEFTLLIENYLDSEDYLPFAKEEEIGKSFDYFSGRNRYIGHLSSLFPKKISDIRIGLDCANGSAYSVAKSVFSNLSANITLINDDPNGKNINENCGSTHPEALQSLVKEKKLDVGFSFDGDADRCICVKENGEIADGDDILYLCGKYLKERNMLQKNTVVTTVMSNYGLYKAFEKENIKTKTTSVGDRFVHECMNKGGYSLGGEQSGHIIFSKYSSTGDGILTALMVLNVMLEEEKGLLELTSELKKYPQTIINVKVSNKDKALSNPELLRLKEETEKKLFGTGRLLIRKSGTEPVIRIMVECENEELSKKYCEALAETIKDI